MVVAQGGGGVADLVEAFDGEGGDELVRAEVGEGGRAVGGWREVGGVEGLEAAEEVELVVCCCDGWGVLGCDFNECEGVLSMDIVGVLHSTASEMKCMK